MFKNCLILCSEMDVKRKWHACTKVIFQLERASKNNSVLYQNNYVDNVTA